MLAEEPPVSIVVAAYNVESWVWQCLESIRTQRYRNFDCIVVDDCSTDRTAEIINTFEGKDKRFRHVRHDSNRGLFHVRKTGLRLCEGKYVWQIDGDDYVDPDGLFHLVRIAEKEASDIVRGHGIIQRGGRILHPNWFPQWPEVINTSLEQCVHLAQNPIAIWLNLVRKDFLDRVDFSNNPSINLGEDVVFNATIFPETDKISLSDANVYYYRRGQKSYTTTSKSERLYLDESVSHRFTFSNWSDLYNAPLMYSMSNSPHRVNQTRELVRYLSKSVALEAISNFQAVYRRWHPLEAYQVANTISPPNWSAEERPDVMQMLIAFHEREAEEIYDLIQREDC